MWTDDNTGRRQHGQHLRHTSGDHWLGNLKGWARFGLPCSLSDPDEQYTDPNADDKRRNGDPDRVHETIVGAKPAPVVPLIPAWVQDPSSVRHLFTLR